MASTALCRSRIEHDRSGAGPVRQAREELRLATEPTPPALVSFSALLREVLIEEAESGGLDLRSLRTLSP